MSKNLRGAFQGWTAQCKAMGQCYEPPLSRTEEISWSHWEGQEAITHNLSKYSSIKTPLSIYCSKVQNCSDTYPLTKVD